MFVDHIFLQINRRTGKTAGLLVSRTMQQYVARKQTGRQRVFGIESRQPRLRTQHYHRLYKNLRYRRRTERREMSKCCQLLHKYRNKLYNKFTTNLSNGVTVGRRVVNSHGASTVVVVNHVDRRRVLLTTRSTCGDEIL